MSLNIIFKNKVRKRTQTETLFVVTVKQLTEENIFLSTRFWLVAKIRKQQFVFVN